MLSNNKTYTNNNLRDVEKVFNDGFCEVYEANERVLGNCKGKFYFAKESVGIAHFFQAYNNNVSVDTAISIPYNNITINSQDVVKLDDEWFDIVRIQYKDNKKPKHWTLSLRRSQFSYTEASNDNN